MTDAYIRSGRWLRYDRKRLIEMLDDYFQLLTDDSPYGSMEVNRQRMLLEKAETAATEQADAFKRMAPDDYTPMPDSPVPMEQENEK